MLSLSTLSDATLDAFVSPIKTIEVARACPRYWWWPVVLVLLATLAYCIWYFNTVDINWLVEVGMKEMASALPPDALAKARRFLTPGILSAQAMFGSTLMLGFWLAAVATYLHLMAKVSRENAVSFLQWLSLAAWSTLPELISILGKAVSYALAGDVQLDPDQLSVTALGPMLGLEASGALKVLLTYDLTGLWSLFILVLGVAHIRAISRSRAATIVLVPWAVLLAARVAIAALH